MSKKFIATIVAGAIAVTSFTAAPARAELSDFEKLLLGVGAMVIIGTAIEESKPSKKKSKPPVVVHQPKKKIVQHKPKRRAAPLPAYCLRNVSTHNGSRRIFGARCLNNNYKQAHRLPDNCKVRVQGPRGTRIGFRPRCLSKAGFRVNGYCKTPPTGASRLR